MEIRPRLKDTSLTCLISGRFDRPHPGHVRTIQVLGQRFERVSVVVLDYPEQQYPVGYRAQILAEILNNSKGAYEIKTSPFHFGRISIDNLLEFDFDVYAAGNLDVLRHLEKIYAESISAQEKRDLRFIWVERPYGYNSSTERLGNIIRSKQHHE